MATEKSHTIKIFYCYAREDQTWRKELEKHLENLRRLGQIASWYDRMIEPGKEWKREIDHHLNTAEIILLLISPDFFASDYCYGVEMKRAMERHEKGEVRVIPVILRPVNWNGAPFEKLQALPFDGKPITTWQYSDEAFRDVAEGISQVVLSLLSERATKNVPTNLDSPTQADPDKPSFRHVDQTPPQHQGHPFALAYLDHTALNVVLVSSLTGKPLGRPWVTVLIDAYSRRCLAIYATFDPPSYQSTMMVFRICVKRHECLPKEIVVAHHPDLSGAHFEALLSRYFVTKKECPFASPSSSSVSERFFGTLTQWLSQSPESAQAPRIPSQMIRETDPDRVAVWTLEGFFNCLSEYVYETYDRMGHPSLSMSPREAFTQGMQIAGARFHRIILYSEDFFMLTQPSTRTGVAKVSPSRGIKMNSLYYWNKQMYLPQLRGKAVPVRYDPYDMGVAYVFIEEQWLECVADADKVVHGRSEREWSLILDEWKKQQRQSSKKPVMPGGPLSDRFLLDVITEEMVHLQHQRDLEERAIWEAILDRNPYLSR